MRSLPISTLSRSRNDFMYKFAAWESRAAQSFHERRPGRRDQVFRNRSSHTSLHYLQRISASSQQPKGSILIDPDQHHLRKSRNPGRQPTKGVFAGAHSECCFRRRGLSIVRCLAEFSVDGHDREIFCRVSAPIEPKVALKQRALRLEDDQVNLACGSVFSCARRSDCWESLHHGCDPNDP